MRFISFSNIKVEINYQLKAEINYQLKMPRLTCCFVLWELFFSQIHDGVAPSAFDSGGRRSPVLSKLSRLLLCFAAAPSFFSSCFHKSLFVLFFDGSPENFDMHTLEPHVTTAVSTLKYMLAYLNLYISTADKISHVQVQYVKLCSSAFM